MTPLGAEQADLDAVEAIVRAAGTSFYRGMRVLPPDRRHAMYAVYAFCRIVDDIADEDLFPGPARRLAADQRHFDGAAGPRRRGAGRLGAGHAGGQAAGIVIRFRLAT